MRDQELPRNMPKQTYQLPVNHHKIPEQAGEMHFQGFSNDGGSKLDTKVADRVNSES